MFFYYAEICLNQILVQTPIHPVQLSVCESHIKSGFVKKSMAFSKLRIVNISFFTLLIFCECAMYINVIVFVYLFVFKAYYSSTSVLSMLLAF